MGEQLCQIFLDNQWSAFYAGQVVTGHVKINLRKEKKLRGESTINKYVQVFCTVIPRNKETPPFDYCHLENCILNSYLICHNRN